LGSEIQARDGKIYVYAIEHGNHPDRFGVAVFDRDLDLAGDIHAFDERLSRYKFLCWRNMAFMGDALMVVDTYRPEFTVFRDGATVAGGAAPHDSPDWDRYWASPILSESDRGGVKALTVRFQTVYGFDKGALLLFMDRAKREFTPYLYQLDRDQLTRCPAFRYQLSDGGFFERLAGGYAEGLIGVNEDPINIASDLSEDAARNAGEDVIQLQFWRYRGFDNSDGSVL
jgi:hypothetical protein